MAIILANNATAKLAGAISTAATAITVQSGQGAMFPAPSAPDWFPVTLIDAAGNIEICKCTARTGDILTVTRAQEGTSAKEFAAGSRVSLRITKAVIDYVFSVVNPLTGLTPAADKLTYYTGANSSALATLTAFARNLLDDADAATARATLGAQASDPTLTALAGLVGQADRIPYFNGADTAALATLTAFARTLLDDADAAAARSTLGAQASDATLTAISGLSSAADKLPYFTGADTATLTTLTAFARTILDDADAATARATLGAQASDPTLTALAGLTGAADRLPYFNGAESATLATFTAFARTLLDDADAAAARATLGVLSTDEPYKSAADVATTANFAATYTNGSSGVGAKLTASAVGVSSIDGVSLTAGMRVLVKNQTTAAQNGIYTVTTAGTASVATVLTRSTDSDTAARIAGAVVTVDQGTTNGAGLFTTDFKKSSTIGTTAMNWRSVWDSGNLPVSTFAKTILDDADAASVRSTIGAQASDATLTALAGLATGADKLPYFTGTDTASVTPITAFARTILDDTSAPAVINTIGATATADFQFIDYYNTSGYLEIPKSGGGVVILQWGRTDAIAQSTTATTTVTFRQAFPNKAVTILTTPLTTSNTASGVATVDRDRVYRESFSIRNDSDNAFPNVYWFAIGF